MKNTPLKTRDERIAWLLKHLDSAAYSKQNYDRFDDVEVWKIYIQSRYGWTSVNTVDDVKAFFADLIEFGLIFHPDTPFKDYVTFGHGDVQSPLFDAEDVAALERTRTRCFTICAKAGSDQIYALACEVAQEAGHMPKPEVELSPERYAQLWAELAKAFTDLGYPCESEHSGGGFIVIFLKTGFVDYPEICIGDANDTIGYSWQTADGGVEGGAETEFELGEVEARQIAMAIIHKMKVLREGLDATQTCPHCQHVTDSDLVTCPKCDKPIRSMETVKPIANAGLEAAGITDSMAHKYLKNSNYCPACNSDNISAGTIHNPTNDDKICQDVRCLDCKLEWQDVFNLSSIKIVSVGVKS